MYINPLGKTFRDETGIQRQFLFGGRRYIIHILIWLVSGIFFYHSNSLRESIDALLKSFEIHESKLLGYKLVGLSIGLLLSAGLVYFFLLRVVPYARFKMRRRYIWAYITLMLFIFIMISVSITLLYAFTKSTALFYLLTINIAVYTIQLFFYSFFYFLDIYDKQKAFTQFEHSLQQRVEAESKFLASQINPHFLFNTINNIYALTISNPNEAKRAIDKMESLISYIHNECQQEWIHLEDEIEFIRSYLNLELLRNNEKDIQLLYEVDGDMTNKKIAPLILINFIENAFKHGVKIDTGKSFVHIRIDISDNNLIFTINNSKSRSKVTSINKRTGGIGLQNVRRRLELIYQKKYSLKIKDKKTYYEVRLILENIKW